MSVLCPCRPLTLEWPRRGAPLKNVLSSFEEQYKLSSESTEVGLHIVTRSDPVSKLRFLEPIPIQGIEMTHSKGYSKSILTSCTSGIWEKSNNKIIKYHPTNHKIMVYSNKMKKFDMWTLPWQALWQLPLHIITVQAVAVGCVWCSWWQFSTFQS